MRKPSGAGWIFAALALAAPGFAVSQGNTTDTFIKGTTDFLLDRANDNYIYIFQRKLEANPLLQKYLPETLRVARAGDLQSLIMHKELWREALRRDLVGQGNRLFETALKESTAYIGALCIGELTKASSDADVAVVAAPCNTVVAKLGEVIGSWERYTNEWKEHVENRVCKAETTKDRAENERNKRACEDGLKQIEKTRTQIIDARSRLSAIQEEIRKKTQGAQQQAKDTQDKPATGPKAANPPRTVVGFMTPGAKNALSDLTRDLDGLRPESCTNLDVGRYTGCVIEILAILKAVSHADYVANCYMFGNMCSNRRDKVNANFEESDDFADFQRYALFFAQLADATGTSDRAQVNALLKSVTIPPVSFGIKREPHATRVLVTAYVGLATSWQTAGSHERASGILAPVGLEISQARDSGNSLSLFISPLDFGYPLTLKLKDTETTIKGSDVVVPSAYVFYGWKNYPLAAGLGYTRGRGIDNPDERVGRFVILLAFDMPLFKLH